MAKCKVDACERDSTAQGFCGRHYKNFIRTGSPLGKTKRIEKGAAQRHPLYQTWLGMRARCLYENNRSYPNYGGRGIGICDQWSDFWTFVADIGPRPSAHHSLDRIDVNGNYEPKNCRWSTPKQQSWNKRSTKLSEKQRDFLIGLVPSGQSISSICRTNEIDYDAALRFLDGRNYAPDKVDHAAVAPAKEVDFGLIAFRPPQPNMCSIESCDEFAYGNGFCRLHYRRARESNSLAGVADISAPRHCQNCNAQMPDPTRPDALFCDRSCKLKFHRREGCYTQEAQLASRGACEIPGCGSPKHAQGVCRKHYMKAWHANQKNTEKPG